MPKTQHDPKLEDAKKIADLRRDVDKLTNVLQTVQQRLTAAGL